MKKTTVEVSQELYNKAMLKAAQNEIYHFSALIRTLLTKYVEV